MLECLQTAASEAKTTDESDLRTATQLVADAAEVPACPFLLRYSRLDRIS